MKQNEIEYLEDKTLMCQLPKFCVIVIQISAPYPKKHILQWK